MQQHWNEPIAQLHCAVTEYPDSYKSWIWITPNAENSHHLPIDSIEIEMLKILLDLTLILWAFDSSNECIYHHQWQSYLKMISFSVLSKKIKIFKYWPRFIFQNSCRTHLLLELFIRLLINVIHLINYSSNKCKYFNSYQNIFMAEVLV